MSDELLAIVSSSVRLVVVVVVVFIVEGVTPVVPVVGVAVVSTVPVALTPLVPLTLVVLVPLEVVRLVSTVGLGTGEVDVIVVVVLPEVVGCVDSVTVVSVVVLSVTVVSAVVVTSSSLVLAQPPSATHRTASAMSEVFRSDFIVSSKLSS